MIKSKKEDENEKFLQKIKTMLKEGKKSTIKDTKPTTVVVPDVKKQANEKFFEKIKTMLKEGKKPTIKDAKTTTVVVPDVKKSTIKDTKPTTVVVPDVKKQANEKFFEKIKTMLKEGKTPAIKDVKPTTVVVPDVKKIKTRIDSYNIDKEFELYYPSLDDKNFKEKLSNRKEYNIYKIKEYQQIKNIKEIDNISKNLCKFEKTLYQYLVNQYISIRTPYKSLLLYHAVGVGKTCSAITVAESFLNNHSLDDTPKIWVIMPISLKQSFKSQIFSLSKLSNLSTIFEQCTADTYYKLLNIKEKDNNVKNLNLMLKKIIKSRYKLFTYDAFTKHLNNEYIKKGKTVDDKIIIVDEAHNIRNDDDFKNAFKYTIEKGNNNKLLLLTATPMYNEPEDIFELLYFLVLNDKRYDILDKFFKSSSILKVFDDKNEIKENIKQLLKKLSGNYISYIRAKNPFSFALRLNPSDSQIDVLKNVIKKDSNNNDIPQKDNNWIESVKNNIVISNASEKQIKYLDRVKTIDENNIFSGSAQPMNIIFDKENGQNGFYNFFNRVGTTEPITVKYNTNYKNALFPDSDNLGMYSGKMLKLCNIIRNSEGIVIIYSRFIWAGIIPLSIALEHMGFNREGTNNFLNNNDKIENVKYEGIKYPKYCILSSSDPEIMGKTTIDDLLPMINSNDNFRGKNIKVVFITQATSEGLNFKNVREIHILEPWYHFNRLEQIIGRGIRNCSHSLLPFSERNVTIYMYGLIKDYIKETPDIHAFRIATRKLSQTIILNKIIRDNAIDSLLMKNINYFPKDLFDIDDINIITSQKKLIEDKDFIYNLLSDDKSLEPETKEIDKNYLDDKGFRYETYKNIIPTIKNKIKKLILDKLKDNIRYISFKEIINYIDIDEKIIYETILNISYPNKFIEDNNIILHKEGIYISEEKEKEYEKIQLIVSEEKIELDKDIIYNKTLLDLENIKGKNIYEATLFLYLNILNSQNWLIIIKYIIENKKLNEALQYTADILYSNGCLISKKEIETYKKQENLNEYIGYVNIFNIDSLNKENYYLFIDNKYRQITNNEFELLLKSRKIMETPDMSKETLEYGLISPIIDKKNNIVDFTFKILLSGKGVGKKTGMVCTSLKKDEQMAIIKKMKLKEDEIKGNKNLICSFIFIKLLELKRMIIYPLLKPSL